MGWGGTIWVVMKRELGGMLYLASVSIEFLKDGRRFLRPGDNFVLVDVVEVLM